MLRIVTGVCAEIESRTVLQYCTTLHVHALTAARVTSKNFDTELSTTLRRLWMLSVAGCLNAVQRSVGRRSDRSHRSCQISE